MYISAYDTTACRPLLNSAMKTVKIVAEANAKGELISRTNAGSMRYDSQVPIPIGVRIFLGYSGGDQLMLPIPVYREDTQSDEFVLVDGRAHAAANPAKDKIFRPKNEDNWRLLLAIAGLTRQLQEGNSGNYDPLIKPTARVFANWIRTAVTRKFRVPEHLHETVEAIAAIYCYGLFRKSNSELSAEAKEMWLIRLKREFRFRSPDAINGVMDKITVMRSLSDLAENIIRICDTPAFEGLNSLTLLQAAHTGWDPMSGAFLLSASLEHLPTLVAVIYISQHQSFSRMPLSKSVYSLLGKEHAEYAKRVEQIVFL